VAREEEEIKTKIKIISRIEVPAETVKLVNLEETESGTGLQNQKS
jgi:hypothetical protein